MGDRRAIAVTIRTAKTGQIWNFRINLAVAKYGKSESGGVAAVASLTRCPWSRGTGRLIKQRVPSELSDSKGRWLPGWQRAIEEATREVSTLVSLLAG